ncbi:CU044_2847 family protein [Amycolatopsis sp. lyj-108]|uniref:CU044_2847 family protein n=1 Tax=Amycolatopsis sp. lyj-108 TaxID=2789286 RepID=UPI00397A7D40
MTKLVEFPVGEDTKALVTFEVDADELSDDLVLASRDSTAVFGRAQTSLEAALNQVKPSLVKVAALVKELAPSETKLEFGLKMGGETGVIVAKGTAEANFKLTLVWTAE